ncbi:MAG: methyltransferase [Marinisporobacter sp.]|jgi:SAM-dependent methyltransferase|nr:methyltransferase [Marinisporobacter sp.]
MNGMLDYYSKLHQYREAQLLLSSIRLKVFSYLSTPKTAMEIADTLNYDCRNLDIFLNSLAAIGLLESKDNKYNNTESTNRLLNENSSMYIGDTILFREEMISLENLEERVKNGPDPKITEKKDGVGLYDFYKLAKLTRKEMYLGRVQNILKLAETLFEKDKGFKVLDLGGGSGTLALEIAKAFPKSEVVIFEHSSVAPLPKALIEEEKLKNRARVIEGNFNVDRIGEEYDLVIASGVMDFARHYLNDVTFKLYNSLKEKGYLYVITHGVREDYLSPKESIVGWLSGRLNGSDLLTDEKTILSSILSKGFKKIERKNEAAGKLKAYLFVK